MIVSKDIKVEKRVEIDLTGPEGNAFYLLGLAADLARKLGYAPEGIGELTNKMISGDYENLIQVFDEEFGDYVILWR